MTQSRPHPRHVLCAAAALAAATVLGPLARADQAPPSVAPYEDIVEVLSDFTWHLHDDLYRFPPPRDVTGHDLYLLTLRRLENWQRMYPERFPDVVAFAKGEVLERLGQYAAAAEEYRRVPAGSPLAAAAGKALDRAREFAQVAAMPEEETADLAATLKRIRKKLDAWANVIERVKGTPYESLALAEEERLESKVGDIVLRRRAALVNGDATAERALRLLVQKHARSRRLPEHILRLGDFYADLAREYVATHPRPLDFDLDTFTARADRALEMYRKVATWDGIPEKLEGEGKLAAFEAYRKRIVAAHR